MRNYVVWIHGIGNQKRDSYQPFQDKIRLAFDERVRRATGIDPPEDAIIWKNAHWADVTQSDQDKLKVILGVKGQPQTFFIDGLGDAVAYSRLPGGGGKFEAVQDVFREAVESLDSTASELEEEDAHGSLFVISHSLGAVIATGSIGRMQDT